MGDRSSIEWTDATWNPVVGCSKVSPGCDNCYAISASARIQGTGNEAYQGIVEDGDWTELVRCLPGRLEQPLRWQRPRRIFVNSMSDLFHPDVPAEFQGEVWAVMSMATRHQFQILTKRPRAMRFVGHPMFRLHVNSQRLERGVSVLPDSRQEDGNYAWPLPNVWLGTSIENDRYTFRADHLRETPAAVRFLSLEPLLGPLPSLDLTGIDWVIVGGESGPGARPMHPDWARDIRDRCVDAGVPFFFKQWGSYRPVTVEDDATFSGGRAFDHPEGGRQSSSVRDVSTKPFTSGTRRPMEPGDETRGGLVMLDRDTIAVRLSKKTAGRELDGRTWGEYPMTGVTT